MLTFYEPGICFNYTYTCTINVTFIVVAIVGAIHVFLILPEFRNTVDNIKRKRYVF
jgi:hypothetical protein